MSHKFYLLNGIKSIMKIFNFIHNEEICRKQWLYITIFQSLFVPFLLLISMCINAIFDLFVVGQLIGSTLGALLGIWMGYHCAYKKRGVKLLNFWLICSVFSFFYQVIILYTGDFDPITIYITFSLTNNLKQLQLLIPLLILLLFIVWTSLTFHLRKFNKKRLMDYQFALEKLKSNN